MRFTRDALAVLRLGALSGVALAMAGGGSGRAEAATTTVSSTVTVAPVTLPEKKAGARELRFALGEAPEEAVRKELEASLADRHAFASVVSEGGDYTLEVTVVSAHQEYIDLTGVRGAGSPLIVSARMNTRWMRQGVAVHESPIEPKRTKDLDGAPLRTVVAGLWRDLFHEAAEIAFADAYEAGAFGSKPGEPWIAEAPK